MNSKHTPGPWRWWETVGGARVAGHPADGSKNFVCDVLIPERDVSFMDNARLIAAAPDLLAALQAIISHDRHLLPNPWRIEAAISAIAKATGIEA